jgi:hypothetical protein
MINRREAARSSKSSLARIINTSSIASLRCLYGPSIAQGRLFLTVDGGTGSAPGVPRRDECQRRARVAAHHLLEHGDRAKVG